MLRITRTPALGATALLALLAPTTALAASAGAGVGPRFPAVIQQGSHTSSGAPAVPGAGALWATIDVCGAAAEPDTVGIRGSMPGDGHARDRMFMRFRLQYLTPQHRWADVARAASGYAAVGTGAAARQGGTSFELVPARSAVTLRGVVEFQWRRGARLVLAASRVTSAGRHSLAGADPPGFSAAGCVIG